MFCEEVEVYWPPVEYNYPKKKYIYNINNN